MILHGVPLSPFVRKTMFVLEELGLDYEQKMVLPNGEASDFRQTSPLGRIPGFEDGDFKLSDSSAICHYLALRHHDSALMQRDNPQLFARIVGFDKYADEDVGPPMLSLLFECLVKRIRLQQSPDEARVATLLNDTLPPVLSYLEARLSESEGEWFVGRDCSYADLALAGHLTSLSLIDQPLDAARWPLLAAWFERVSARASVAQSLEATRRFAEGA